MSIKTMSRRKLLRSIPAAAAGVAVAGCTVSTLNGVTTISVKNAVVENYTDVGIEVLKAALGFTGVPAAIVTVVDTGISVVQAALAAYIKTAGTTTVLTFNSTSVPAALTSLISDLSTVASDISAAAAAEKSNLSADLTTKITQVASDVATAGSVIESMISAITSAPLSAGAVPAEERRQFVIDGIKARYGIN